MSDPYPIVECLDDIVARLQAQMTYLASCKDVGDIRTALALSEVITPALRIAWAGETINPPLNVSANRQLSRFRWDIFIIATNFSADIEGRRDLTVPSGTESGIYTMVRDVGNALRGYQLPSQVPFGSKLYGIATEPWDITEAQVIYRSQWYCDVILGTAA